MNGETFQWNINNDLTEDVCLVYDVFREGSKPFNFRFRLRIIGKKWDVVLQDVKKGENGEEYERIASRGSIRVSELKDLFNKRKEAHRNLFSVSVASLLSSGKDLTKLEDTIDIICNDVINTRGKLLKPIEKEEDQLYELALDAKVQYELDHSGYDQFSQILTDFTYLPWVRTGGSEEENLPSIIARSPKKLEFFNLKQHNEIFGHPLSRDGYPGRNMPTLFTNNGVIDLKEFWNTPPTKLKPQLEDHILTINERISQEIKEHVYIEEIYAIVVKHWIIGSYFYHIFDSFPLQLITGFSETGKTRLLMLLRSLCYHARPLQDPSPASVYRTIGDTKCTLCVNEVEFLNNKDIAFRLRSVLNSCYSKEEGVVTRYDQDSDGRRVPNDFWIYAPIAIASIAGIEGVTKGRFIEVVMEKSMKNYPKAYMKDPVHFDIRDDLYIARFLFCYDVEKEYRSLDLKGVVSARFDELFRPLLTFGKIFGTEEEFKELKMFAKEYEEDFRAETSTLYGEEAGVFQVLVQMMVDQKVEDLDTTIQDVVDTYGKTFTNKITNRKVGGILKRFKIRKKRTRKSTDFSVSKRQLRRTGRTYNLPIDDLKGSKDAKL